MGRADRGAEIVQPVPDLHNHEEAQLVDAQVHVDRVGRVGGSGRQLEGAAPSVRLDQPKDELLAREMSRVRHLGFHGAREGNGKGPPDRETNGNPSCDRGSVGLAALKVRIPRPAQADSIGHLLLRHLEASPAHASLSAQRREERPRFAVAVHLRTGSSDTRVLGSHDDAIVTLGSWLGLIPAWSHAAHSWTPVSCVASKSTGGVRAAGSSKSAPNPGI